MPRVRSGLFVYNGLMKIEEAFSGVSWNKEKLLAYGFREIEGALCYQTPIKEGMFLLTIVLGKTPTSSLIDQETGDPYVLHLLPHTTSGFAAEVRKELDDLYLDIVSNCGTKARYSSPQLERVFAYVKKEFDEVPDHPFSNDEGIVLRRADNKKWYFIYMRPKGSVIGLDRERVDIIDIRIEKYSPEIGDGRIHPAYHMNKHSWCTIVLDDQMGDEELFARIAKSRELALKK